MWRNKIHDRLAMRLYIGTIFLEVNSAIIINVF